MGRKRSGDSGNVKDVTAGASQNCPLQDLAVAETDSGTMLGGDVPNSNKLSGILGSKAQAELSSIPGGKELLDDISGASGRSFNEAGQLANRQVAAIALQKLRSGNFDDAVVALERSVFEKNGKLVTKLDVETATQIIEIKGGLKNQSSLNPKKQKQFFAELNEAKKTGKQLVYQFDGPVNPKLVQKLEKRGAIVVQDKIDLSILDN